MLLTASARAIWRRAFLALRRVVPSPLKDLYRLAVPRSMTESFRDAYLLDQWGSGSGIGSTPEHTTAYREFLQGFLRARAIRSVVDLGCGDWSFSRLIDWSGIRYTGLDTVPEVIEADRRAFGDRGQFLCLDVTRDELPGADVALVKDVLQHWPNDAIRSLVARLRTRYRYALITNCCYEDPRLNAEIGMGGYRPLDLRLAPFSYDLEEMLRFRVSGREKVVLLLS